MNSPSEHARIAPLTVDQVHAMLRAGILQEGTPIELIDGQLVYKNRSAAGKEPMTVGELHNLVVKLLAELDAELRTRGCHLQAQGPVSMPPHNEPEPDGAVLRGTPRNYATRLPTAHDAEAIVEVADSSLRYDRTTKLAIYAGAAVAQYVIVNIPDDVVEVYEDPDPQKRKYRTTTILRRGEAVSIRATVGRLDVPVERLLP
jgi:Uma2 family endonuclease